jgi:hypothetical protein
MESCYSGFNPEQKSRFVRMQTFRESDLSDKHLNNCILEIMTTIKGQNK